MSLYLDTPIKDVAYGSIGLTRMYCGHSLVWQAGREISDAMIEAFREHPWNYIDALEEGYKEDLSDQERWPYGEPKTVVLAAFIKEGGQIDLRYTVKPDALSALPYVSIRRENNIVTVTASNALGNSQEFKAPALGGKYSLVIAFALCVHIDGLRLLNKAGTGFNSNPTMYSGFWVGTNWSEYTVTANDKVLLPAELKDDAPNTIKEIGKVDAISAKFDKVIRATVEDHCTVSRSAIDLVKAMGNKGYAHIWDSAPSPDTGMGQTLQTYDFCGWLGPGGDILLTDYNHDDNSDWPCRIWSDGAAINVGSGDYQAAWAKPLNDAKWHHIYVSIDSTGSTTKAHVWCDGNDEWEDVLPGKHISRPQFNSNAVKTNGAAGYWVVLGKDSGYRQMFLDNAARMGKR